MIDYGQDNRENRRVKRPFTIQYCVNDYPQKWDMSTIQNISAGGVRFAVAGQMQDLTNKIIHLRIKIPEITHVLEMQALVLEVIPRANTRFFDVRAKFFNLTELNKKDLAFIGRIIDSNVSE